DEGADVVVLMTPSATRFVGPLTFAALTTHPVETDVGGLLPDERIGHIVVADSADAIVVAPATAHWLAAMATGLAGDAVTAAGLPVGGRSGDGRRDVRPPGDPGDRCPPPRRLRLPDRRARRGSARVRPVGPGTARGERRHRRRRGRVHRRSTDPGARSCPPP